MLFMVVRTYPLVGPAKLLDRYWLREIVHPADQFLSLPRIYFISAVLIVSDIEPCVAYLPSAFAVAYPSLLRMQFGKRAALTYHGSRWKRFASCNVGLSTFIF